MKLSDTQSLILSKASQHPERLAAALKTLPAAARSAVFRSMLKNGLLEECAAPREYAGLAWREDADGARIALRITEAGLRAIGVAPDEGAAPDTATVADTAPTAAPDAQPLPAGGGGEGALAAEAAQHAPAAPDEATCAEALVCQDQPAAAPVPMGGTNLRQAAQAVLDAWDDDSDRGALAGPMERLRTMLAKPASAARDPDAPRKPREGTKQQKVLAMLRRPEGATIAQIAEATGWAAHTVRGFFAGLKKKGIAVAVLERVRQVGPNKAGAKGSYSIYRIADAAMAADAAPGAAC
jgi:Protein of unknown function (DUF3489)